MANSEKLHGLRFRTISACKVGKTRSVSMNIISVPDIKENEKRKTSNLEPFFEERKKNDIKICGGSETPEKLMVVCAGVGSSDVERRVGGVMCLLQGMFRLC